MATLVFDPLVEEQIRAERAARGADRYDEVWEGTYMMAPMPNMEHQELATSLAGILDGVLRRLKLGKVFAGANVSDREEGWTENFRAPDVVAVLNSSLAKDCGTHLCGGPDFLVEVISPDDRSRDKLTFYGRIGVRELMIIERDPWSLELYRLEGDELRLASASRPGDASFVESAVIPFSFRLLPSQPRPQVEVVHRDSEQRWVV
jgi:Uma2 family endonuclease